MTIRAKAAITFKHTYNRSVEGADYAVQGEEAFRTVKGMNNKVQLAQTES